MNSFLNFLGGMLMIAVLYGFFFLYGYIWENKEKYEFGIGVLSLTGWVAIGGLIVAWVFRLAYRKK